MKIRTITATLAIVGVAIATAACGGKTDPGTTTPAGAVATTEAAATVTPTPPTMADHAASVTAALDALGVAHTEPVRGDVKLSGAAANYDLTIGGADAGILIFPTADALNAWKTLASKYGGVAVIVASVPMAVSLDSDETVSASVALAPKLANALGGQTLGV